MIKNLYDKKKKARNLLLDNVISIISTKSERIDFNYYIELEKATKAFIVFDKHCVETTNNISKLLVVTSTALIILNLIQMFK